MLEGNGSAGMLISCSLAIRLPPATTLGREKCRAARLSSVETMRQMNGSLIANPRTMKAYLWRRKSRPTNQGYCNSPHFFNRFYGLAEIGRTLDNTRGRQLRGNCVLG
jgi:hypothetical protein